MVITDSEGQILRYRTITITSKIGNPDNILWSGGKAGEWGEAAFFVRVPAEYGPGSQVKIYVWNSQGQKLWLDDLRLELWR